MSGPAAGCRDVLAGLLPPAAEAAFRARGLPAFRARQALRWLYTKRVFAWAAMSDLPAALREELASSFRLLAGETAHRAAAADGTTKILVRFPDQAAVEAVAIPAPGRLTLCLSTQAGCSVGCPFCATGRGGFRRNLEVAEIVTQALLAPPAGARVDNVVFMGMGEPLLNYEATLGAARVLADRQGLGLGQRKITISTAGLPEGIARLAGEGTQYRLAVSLHAPDQERRARLVPLARRHPLPQLLEALGDYQRRTGRQVTFEYLLLGGVNDSPADAAALLALLRDIRGSLNLIPFNPVPQADWRAPAPAAVRAFAATLARGGRRATVRREKGAEIAAACGQLAGPQEAGR